MPSPGQKGNEFRQIWMGRLIEIISRNRHRSRIVGVDTLHFVCRKYISASARVTRSAFDVALVLRWGLFEVASWVRLGQVFDRGAGVDHPDVPCQRLGNVALGDDAPIRASRASEPFRRIAMTKSVVMTNGIWVSRGCRIPRWSAIRIVISRSSSSCSRMSQTESDQSNAKKRLRSMSERR